ncbi:MAG: hypothetical protein ING84_14720 [Cytophagales bacterium]|nr:hypothetical protein [Cytophagales bacterium]
MVQQAQVALPSFGARTDECYQNERRIPSCEVGTRYPVPSVWGVLSDGGFFACSSLSMTCSGFLFLLQLTSCWVFTLRIWFSILSGLVAQQAQVALPSFGARADECYQNERRIPSCEVGTRYPLPSVWGVLSDGGFFALLSLSMRCAGSLGFDAANKLVGAIRSEFGFQS